MDASTRARFEAKVDRSGGPDACHLWTASRRHGYGQFVVNARRAERSAPTAASRVAWHIENGAIPAGMCVLHRCDNPACVNARHLFLGTQADNVRDMHAKGRAVVHALPVRIGAANHASKLTPRKVRVIRRALARGTVQQRLADRFGVSQTVISHIALGKTWRHV